VSAERGRPQAGTVGGFSDPQHWIRPFVLSFIPAVALGTCGPPLMAGAWAAVAQVGDAIFGTGSDMDEPPPEYWDQRTPRRVSKSRSARVLSVAR
jgi:hypothetical protein